MGLDSTISASMAAESLERVRAVCLALPETVERLSHGAPTFFVQGKRAYAMFLNDHHGDGLLALWCAAGPDAQQMLVAGNPECCFVPPYVGCRGWVGVRLDRGLAWPEVGEILTDAYRAAAPARLLDILDVGADKTKVQET